MSGKASTEPFIARRMGDSALPGEVVNVPVTVGPLVSRDRFDVTLHVTVPLRLNDTKADRAVFAEQFANGPVAVGGQEVADYLRPALTARVEGVASAHDAAGLVDGPPEDAARVIEETLVLPLFAAGLRQAGQPAVRFECMELSRRRVEEAAEHARREASEREADLLRRFEDIRRANPNVPAATLLSGLDEAQRRSVLISTLRATGQRLERPGRVLIVGREVLTEAEPGGQAIEVTALPADLGPLRCVRVGEAGGRRQVVVGARDGLLLGRDRRCRDFSPLPPTGRTGSPYGFSDAALDSEDGYWASHSDYGLWRFTSRGGADRTPPRVGPPYALAGLDAGALLAADRTLLRCTADEAAERLADLPATVVRLLGFDGQTLAVMRDGGMAIISAGRGPEDSTVATSGSAAGSGGGTFGGAATSAGGAITRSLRRAETGLPPEAGEVVSADGLPWLGEVRPVVSTSAGEIWLLGLGDGAAMRYRSPQPGFAAVAASLDIVAGITEDRQRLVAWRPWQPEEPIWDIHLASHLRGRAADLAVL